MRNDEQFIVQFHPLTSNEYSFPNEERGDAEKAWTGTFFISRPPTRFEFSIAHCVIPFIINNISFAEPWFDATFLPTCKFLRVEKTYNIRWEHHSEIKIDRNLKEKLANELDLISISTFARSLIASNGLNKTGRDRRIEQRSRHSPVNDRSIFSRVNTFPMFEGKNETEKSGTVKEAVQRLVNPSHRVLLPRLRVHSSVLINVTTIIVGVGLGNRLNRPTTLHRVLNLRLSSLRGPEPSLSIRLHSRWNLCGD